MPKKTGLSRMLEGNNYSALERMLSFVVLFANQSTKHKRTTSIGSGQTGYGEILCHAIRHIGQRTWSEVEPSSPGRSSMKLKRILV